MDVMFCPSGMSNAYTREGNLRINMASIGAYGLKNELLKNAVNVARYNVKLDSLAGKELGSHFRDNMTDDQRAAVIYNYIRYNGPEEAFGLLDNPEVLKSICRSFVKYRSDKEKKTILDYIARTDVEAFATNESLDACFIRSLSENRGKQHY